MSNTIHQQMAHGALWMLLFKLMERSLGLISTLILVRVLSPADFGVVAMATSFIFMAELLTAFGFDIALIQKQDASEDHYHTAWTLHLLLGLLIAVLMVAAAPWIADFYNRPNVFWVVCALALGPLIRGCENIGVVAFRKEMRFKSEFAFQLSRKVVSFLVVVPLAFYLRSYWALVFGMLASQLAGTIISFIAHPFRPHFSLAKVGSLMGFSKWLLANNMVGFFKERSADFFIGRMHGAAPLGVYNVSYELATMPTTELSAPINRALLPGFARIAHDPKAMRAAYGHAMSMLAILALPAAVGIFAVAPFLVPVVLGNQWLASVPLMEILALNGALLMFHSSICAVLIANGHPYRVTKTNALYVVMLVVLLGILVPGYGTMGAACAALAASILSTPIYLLQVRGSVGVPASDFVRAAARPVLAAVLMVGVVRLVLPGWSAAMSTTVSLTWLIGGMLLGAMTYAAGIGVLWLASGRPEGAERVLIGQLQVRLKKWRAWPAPTFP
ncbi:MAG: lipopolysaccharide biosynthesis protein [Gammaproteobacteria bacterium]